MIQRLNIDPKDGSADNTDQNNTANGKSKKCNLII